MAALARPVLLLFAEAVRLPSDGLLLLLLVVGGGFVPMGLPVPAAVAACFLALRLLLGVVEAKPESSTNASQVSAVHSGA